MDVLPHRYALIRELGSGATSRVLCVRDRLRDETVALKVLGAQVERDALRREFAAAVRLSHPNLVRPYDFGRTIDGLPFFTMELVEGRPLPELARAEPAALVEALRGVLRALAYLHRQGLVHADLKPANLLVAVGPVAKVLDLGACFRDSESDVLAGTPAYMAPERIAGEGRDGRSDLYSLGCILYEALTGSPPFAGREALEIVSMHVAGPRPKVRERRPDAPAQLVEVTERLMARHPGQRFQSAEAVLAFLDGDGANGASPPIGTATALAGRDRELSHLNMLLARAGDGSGGAAVIEGPPGSGKSRLLDELRIAAQLEGCVVLHARAGAGEGPYAPFDRLLAELELESGRVAEEALGEPQALAAVRGGALTGPRLGLFDGFGEALRLLAGASSLLVLLDDLEAASPTAQELALHLVRSTAHRRVVLVAAVGRAETAAALASAGADRLTLGPLGVDAVRAQLGSLLGAADRMQELAGAVHRLAAGVPGAVESVAARLVAAGTLRRTTARWLLVPEDLDLARLQLPPGTVLDVAQALAGVSAPARALAEALSVLARVSEPAWHEAAALAELGPPELAAARVELEVRGVTRADVLAGVAAGLAPSRALALHRAAAARLAGLRTVDGFAALARHLAALGDDGAAAQAARAGAALACEAGAHDEAVALYERARALGGLAPADLAKLAQVRRTRGDLAGARADLVAALALADPGERGHLRRRLAEVELARSDYAAVHALVAETFAQTSGGSLAALAETRGGAAHAETRGGAARAETRGGAAPAETRGGAAPAETRGGAAPAETRGGAAPAETRGGAAPAETRGGAAPAETRGGAAPAETRGGALAPADAVGLIAVDAEALRLSGKLDAAAVRAREGIVLAEAHGDRAGEANLRRLLGDAAWHGGRFDEALVDLERAGAVYAALGDRAGAARAAMARGTALRMKGEHAAAIAAYDLAILELRALGDLLGVAKCHNNIGVVRYLRGDWEGAGRDWERFRDVAERAGEQAEVVNCLNNLSVLYRDRGELERAASAAGRALALARRLGYDRFLAMLLGNLGETHLRRGALEAAASAYDECEEWARKVDARDELVELGRRRAELALAQGALDVAETTAQGALVEARALGQKLEEGNLTRVLGAAAGARGELAQAEQRLGEAHALLAGAGSDVDRARVDAELSRVSRRQHRYLLADRAAQRAAEVFQRVGASWDLEQLRRQSDPGSGDELRAVLLRMQVLDEVSRALGEALDLEELLFTLIDRMIELSGAERGFLLLTDAAGAPAFRVARNMERETLEGSGFEVSRSIIGEVSTSRRTVRLSDVAVAARYATQNSVMALGLRSILCVPLLRKGDTIGVIYLDSRHLFTGSFAADSSLFEAIATQAAMAIENSRLLESLAERNRAVATLVHDLRSPVGTIMLTLDEVRPSDPELAMIVDGARSSGERVQRLIDEVLQLSKLEVAAEVPWTIEVVDPVACIEEAVRGVAPQARDRRVVLELVLEPGLPRVPGNHDKLVRVVTNLVNNAVKFTPDDGRVEVVVGVRDGLAGVAGRGGAWVERVTEVPMRVDPDHHLRFEVRDTGPGIAPDDLRRIFAPFVQGKIGSRRKTEGTGLGLSIARAIVQRLGGRIWAESRVGAGSTFAFTLPVLR